MNVWTASCALLVAAIAGSACGIRYRPHLHAIDVQEEEGAATGFAPARLGMSGSALTHEFTLYDRTGIMLSVLGTAAAAKTARDAELKDMAESGRTWGGYSYQATPVIPGPEFWVTFELGSGSGFDTTLGDTTIETEGDLELMSFGGGIEFGQRQLSERLHLDWTFQGHFPTYTGNPKEGNALVAVDEQIEKDPFYVPFGARLSYLVLPPVRVSLSAEYDVLQSLLGSMLGGGHLWGTELSATVAMTDWMQAEAGARFRSLSNGLNEFQAQINDFSAWIGLRLDTPD